MTSPSSALTRRDHVVVGLLVLLLALIAGGIAAPSFSPMADVPGATASSSPGSSPAPSGRPVAQRPIRVGVLGTPTALTPLTATTSVDRDLVALLYSGLVALGPDQTIVPDLASSWTTTADGRVWTFTLRGDVRWHDGRHVTARDVAFTVSLLRNPTFTGPGGASWRDVTATAVDDRTVRFELSAPIGGFLQAATQPIVPEHLFRDIPLDRLAESPLNRNPIGSGPYRLVTLDATHALLAAVAPGPAPTATPAGPFPSVSADASDRLATAGPRSPRPSGSPSATTSGSPRPSATSAPLRSTRPTASASTRSPRAAASPSASPTRRPRTSPSPTASPSPTRSARPRTTASPAPTRSARLSPTPPVRPSSSPRVSSVASPRGSSSPAVSASPSPVPSPLPSSRLDALAGAPDIELRFFSSGPEIVAAYEAGRLDIAADLSPDDARHLAGKAASRLVRYPSSTLTAVLFNLRPTRPEFRDPAVRLALLRAINRSAIVDAAWDGQAALADAPIPPVSWAFDPTVSRPVAYDPRAAARALAAAGWTTVDNQLWAPDATRPYRIELLSPDVASNHAAFVAAASVVSDWQRLGMSVRHVPLPPGQLVADRLRTGKFAAAVVDINVGLDPDLYPLLASSQTVSTGLNLSGIVDRELDNWLLRARAPGTQQERRMAYRSLQILLAKRQYVLPIAFHDEVLVVRDTVEGPDARQVAGPGDRFWDVLTWRLADDR